jgi:hypothetical protein
LEVSREQKIDHMCRRRRAESHAGRASDRAVFQRHITIAIDIIVIDEFQPELSKGSVWDDHHGRRAGRRPDAMHAVGDNRSFNDARSA